MLDHSFETVDVSLLFHEWSATDIEVSLRKHHHFLKYNFVAFLCPVLLDARGDAAKDWRKAGSSGQGPLPGGEWPSAGQVLAESGGHDDCGAWTWSLILWTSFYLVGSEMLPAIRRVMISALVQCSQLQTREFEVMEAREKRVQSQWRVFLNPQSSFPMFQSRDWLQDGPGEGEVFYVFFWEQSDWPTWAKWSRILHGSFYRVKPPRVGEWGPKDAAGEAGMSSVVGCGFSQCFYHNDWRLWPKRSAFWFCFRNKIWTPKGQTATRSWM